tara:strand:+ start:825 stop:1571 length:747 start_codon:yes stop_codon:yes gene_type:complete
VGHPTRSKHTYDEVEKAGLRETLSEKFIQGMHGFTSWLDTNSYPVTLFVIGDLFLSTEFEQWFSKLLKKYGQRITVGCHGWRHKSWSAWPEDADGFSSDLAKATEKISTHAGDSFRPWFRAPGGYIAPWMAPILAEQGYVLDSSINPSWLVKRKAGKGNSWQDIAQALKQSDILSRPWKTYFSLPINGPALSLFPLSILAKRGWKKAPLPFNVQTFERELMSSESNVSTLYWHLLDHARKKWSPPLRW